ncbi:hypothetical protein KFX89_12425 [Bacteroides thetaiotaomicron]|uniref:hypothetical protein n=1 Tax=Bacteroides thetaiotaomicron TaxID=818 RepID=UPI001CE393C3|nr:hypothetical protein [Bacteroides thetaiotaomicron]MCA6027558.1 hypothetical protein [Bacteroides thetaiotaomicron]
MKIDELNNRHITAEEGKVFRRISDGQLFGNEIYLGYAYYLSGEKLEEPLLELPEHYEEIDDPAEETILIDEDTPLEDTDIEEAITIEDEPTDIEQKKRITVADYHKLEKQVAMLIRIMGGIE